MYKVVLFNSSLELVKKYCNLLFNEFNNIKLAGIASNKKELSFICQNSKINIIILSSKDMKNENISYLLDTIEYKVIIYDSSKNHPKSSKYNLYIPIDSTDEYILEKFSSFISKVNERTIRKKVRRILEKLNFDFKLVGTNYLLESIVYSYLNKDNYLFENLEKKIYPYVSQKYNVSLQNIKWSIIRSINSMKSNLNSASFKNYNIDFPEKITSKLLISEIVNRL